MVTYKNLISVVVLDTNEPLVPITNDVLFGYMPQFSNTQQALKGKMYVRSTVNSKLNKAQNNLEKTNPELSLFVTYGFRSTEIQTQFFIQSLKKNDKFFADANELYEEIHRFVAVPTVAGHPTGGAIDVLIYDKNKKDFIDFGAKQYDFSKNSCYTFSSHISKNGQKNRLLLRKILMDVGFAPFDGEWWHFSYGDREWAYYYKKDSAIYSQIRGKNIKNLWYD